MIKFCKDFVESDMDQEYGSRYRSGDMDRMWARGLDPYLVF